MSETKLSETIICFCCIAIWFGQKESESLQISVYNIDFLYIVFNRVMASLGSDPRHTPSFLVSRLGTFINKTIRVITDSFRSYTN